MLYVTVDALNTYTVSTYVRPFAKVLYHSNVLSSVCKQADVFEMARIPTP